MKKITHNPVLVNEVVDILHIKNQARYIDATLGLGGHSSKIISLGGFVLGFEYDLEMVPKAEKNLSKACPPHQNLVGCFKILNRNFADIASIAQSENLGEFDGILFDLGISLLHYKQIKRGFSFVNLQEPLDMRLNQKRQAVTAADLLNNLDRSALNKLFEPIVGYKETKVLVERIIKVRPLYTVEDLVNIIPVSHKYKKNPSTKTFLALRIAVNSELENIKISFPAFLQLLKNNGKFLVITFHSLEEKTVKQIFKDWETKNLGKLEGPIVPTEEEIGSNSLARSARLWVFIKNDKQ